MSQQWTPPPAGGAPANVPNYLALAILSIFCCTPLGIAAIIFAAQVNGKVQQGDIAGAMDSSKKAKMFAIIGIALGLLAIGIYVIWIVLVVGLSAAGNF
jgi:hypothetical protein